MRYCVPCALIVLARRPGPVNGDGTGDEIGRASQDQSKLLVQAKGLDSSREEVLEAIGT